MMAMYTSIWNIENLELIGVACLVYWSHGVEFYRG